MPATEQNLTADVGAVLREAGRPEVEASLRRLLASSGFAKSPRQQSLLTYLVGQSLSGHGERLKGYAIGIDVFGRGPEFDPAVDAIVRVEVGRLRNKLREYYDGPGTADEFVFDLPKGAYAVQVLGNSAWKTLRGRTPLTPVADGPPEGMPSVAVLPFANLGADDGQDYFADGLTDSLIFGLSRLSGLFVVSRQSSFAYRNSTKLTQEIGRELDVRLLLQGSVQRSGPRLRVTVQLVEAATGGHLWAERFETDVQNIFELQDNVTQGIIRILQVKLAPAEAAMFGHDGTASIEAHDALLRGMECYWKFSPRFIPAARRYFEHAVSHDPTYAAAHAWMARVLIHQWIMKWDAGPDGRERALAHAQRSVELDPGLPYGVSVLGWVHLWLRNEAPAVAYCRQAVSLDPHNPEPLAILSMVLTSCGQAEEALVHIDKARRLARQPSPFHEFVTGHAFFALEDYDQARAALERGCALSETFVPNHIHLCAVYALLGMEQAMKERRDHVMVLAGGDKDRIIEAPWIDEKLRALYLHLLRTAGLPL